MLGVLLALPAPTTPAAAGVQPVVIERSPDVTVRLLVEGGKLVLGPNDVVGEIGPLPAVAASAA